MLWFLWLLIYFYLFNDRFCSSLGVRFDRFVFNTTLTSLLMTVSVIFICHFFIAFFTSNHPVVCFHFCSLFFWLFFCFFFIYFFCFLWWFFDNFISNFFYFFNWLFNCFFLLCFFIILISTTLILLIYYSVEILFI